MELPLNIQFRRLQLLLSLHFLRLSKQHDTSRIGRKKKFEKTKNKVEKINFEF
jgi:hypothetical protein